MSFRWVRRFVHQAALAVALVSPAQALPAQVAQLPFDLIDVADDVLAPDHCGITFGYFDLDPTAHSEAGGVSVADFDNDGLLDIFLPNNQGRVNKLYKNQGDGTFVDVAAARGVDDPTSASSNALFLDYDHDGDRDLLVVSHLGHPQLPLGPAVKLFRNGGAPTGYLFSDVTATAGFVFGPTGKTTQWGWTSGICAGDYDRDGWVDLFISWHGAGQSQDQWRLLRNEPNPAPGSPTDRNYTPRVFVDATPNSGLEGEYGGDPWQAMFWDVNRDGYPDIHVAQDFTLDVMFINNKDGTFTNVATAVGLNGDPPEFRNEMGTVLGDPDGDLDLDMHTTNVGMKDRYYRNDSIGTALAFTDIAVASGLHDCVFGWGTVFADLDNDGDEDHAAVTGFEHDVTLAYINPVHINLAPQLLAGGEGVAWADATDLLSEFSKAGTEDGDSARGLAALDYDNDGDVDLVMTRNHSKTGLFKNTLASDHHWLEVDLVNTNGSLDTTGSRVYVNQGGRTQLRELFTGSSFLSQQSPRLHFGLGPFEWKGTERAKSASTGTTGTGPGGPLGGATGAGSGGTPSVAGEPGPRWLVVQWPDGAYQILLQPQRDTIHTVVRSAVNDAGDMNADGHLTAVDQTMLLLATQDPVAFAAAYPFSPGLVVGDIDGNGVLDNDDYTAWSSLPPH
ncbi:MAG: CRTAC1 family protein [Planctomycetota bacterium]|jgi:hypothetical protein